MDRPPQLPLQLGGRDYLAGTREKKPESRQLFGRQMNRHIGAQERAARFKTELAERKGWFGNCRQMEAGRIHPIAVWRPSRAPLQWPWAMRTWSFRIFQPSSRPDEAKLRKQGRA